ncbi:MAG: amidohydrolase family protein, partial [Victivallales bacterium]|nr:amidohydrolase family protein [Victivallales bacterium]
MPQLTANIVTDQECFYGTLAWEGDTITDVKRTGVPIADEPLLLAGFIDVHLHGLGPFTAENPDGCLGMAEYAPCTGATMLCPTLSCAPEEYLVSMMSAIRGFTRNVPRGAVIAGTHMEGPWLNLDYAGGMVRSMIRPPSIQEAQAFLDAAQGSLRLLTIAPEMPGALDVIRLLVANGVTVSAGHTGCAPHALAQAVDAGVSEITHLFDAYALPEDAEGVRQPALTDMALVNDHVFKEIIMDGLHVPPELVHLARRAAGAGKIIAITDAMQGAGMKSGHFTDMGVPYTIREGDFARADATGNILGSSLSLNQAFHNMTTRFGFSLPEASRCLSANPARTLKMEQQTGRLAPGLFADLAVLAPDHRTVLQCFVRGAKMHG